LWLRAVNLRNFSFSVEQNGEQGIKDTEDENSVNFIPSVPRSSFLMRRSRTPSPVRERNTATGYVIVTLKVETFAFFWSFSRKFMPLDILNQKNAKVFFRHKKS